MDELIKKSLQLKAKQLVIVPNSKPVIYKESGKFTADQNIILKKDMISFVRGLIGENVSTFKQNGFLKGIYHLEDFGSCPYELNYKSSALELVFLLESFEIIPKNKKEKTETSIEQVEDGTRNIEQKKNKTIKQSFQKSDENSIVLLAEEKEVQEAVEEYAKKHKLKTIICSSQEELMSFMFEKSCKRYIFSSSFPNFLQLFKPFYDLPFLDRKEIYLVLISAKDKSGDHEVAFLQSVDFVINKDEIEKFEQLFDQGQEERLAFFKQYNSQ